uniref:SCP domain-containing protein n=1 Tax=Macrostomum lignano TaxID=282301 RepID=A0A1I8I0J0_9PLAT
MQTKARMEQFIKEILDSHNAYRKRHQAPALRLSQDLTESAQSWAEHIAGNDKLEHDTQCQKDKIGENVAMKYSSVHSDFPGNLFTDYWYREIEDYNFEGNVEDQIQCGHFTQVVWKASEEVGFGRAVSKSGRVYVVGRYRPAGNYMGEFGKNVLPPADGKIVLPETEQDMATIRISDIRNESLTN